MDSDTRKETVKKLLVSVPIYIQKVQCDTDQRTTPFKCAVNTCRNFFVSFEEREKYPYKFHNFPREAGLCSVWKQQCGLSQDVDILKLKVCSDHFSLDDYIRNYKEEFLNPNFKRKLKPNAIPQAILRTPSISGITSPSINQNEELSCSITSPNISDNDELSCSITNPNISNNEELSPIIVSPSISHKEKLSLKDIKETIAENTRLTEKYRELLRAKRDAKNKIIVMKKKIASKTKDLKTLQNELKENRRNRNNVWDDKDSVIRKVFSEAQINLLIGKRRVFWTDDDLAKAFTLRHTGTKECYLYLKNTLNIPLPALSCVQKWAASCNTL